MCDVYGHEGEQERGHRARSVGPSPGEHVWQGVGGVDVRRGMGEQVGGGREDPWI